MGRILWVLPLCLIFQGQNAPVEVAEMGGKPDQVVKADKPKVYEPKERDLICHDLVGALGLMPSAGVPGGLPWYALYQIGSKQLFPVENILVYQPSLFLQMCLERYDREIQGYTVLFCKQERVKGKLQKAEKILVNFREQPFSVNFQWKEGNPTIASKVLYVEGENNGTLENKTIGSRMKVRAIFVLNKDPDGAEAKETSRFSIKRFGVRHGLASTVASIARAEAAGTLNLKYDGKFKVDNLGGRTCYRFTRDPYNPPEEDGISKYVFYIDVKTELHLGSELRGVNNELIAEYWFRDLTPNEFDPEMFTDKGLAN